MWADPAVAAALNAQTLAVLWLGAFLGGLAAGGAGFAFGIVGSSIWLHALSPVHSTMLVVSGGTILQIGFIWPLRHSIEPRRLAPFLLAGMIGVPFGVILLVHPDPQALQVALGVLLGLY